MDARPSRPSDLTGQQAGTQDTSSSGYMAFLVVERYGGKAIQVLGQATFHLDGLSRTMTNGLILIGNQLRFDLEKTINVLRIQHGKTRIHTL